MRIAQVAPYYHPHLGGVESHVETISEELARRGHDVHVVTSHLEDTPLQEERHGVTIHRVPQLFNLFTTPVTPRLEEALRKHGPYDLVHAHSPPPVTAWYSARAARKLRTPHVLTYHCDLEIPSIVGPAVVGIFRRTLGRYTVNHSEALVATTRSYAATSRALWHRGDVAVIPNPVDPSRFSPNIKGDAIRRRHNVGDRPVALFVGRLTHHKGVDDFVRAAQFTPANVVHLVVGGGPWDGHLQRMVKDLGVEGKVILAGKVDYHDLPRYYAAATMGVLPSTSRLEAFGIAALEAMATGRPVVLSRMPGMQEVIEDAETGLLAEPADPKDLAEKITRIALDPELAASMGKRGRARILEGFTLERVVDALEKVYEGVLTARGGAGRP
ncbi:MAG TPA: glycosyltransferase family 4 protein [Candidatus Thermoplasmatota archaeon]|nr:glycosyltransferase family 4 protein [Candidatus Thermoplasmatota archaeon]